MQIELDQTFSALMERELPEALAEAVQHRRHLHMHPEVGFDTQETEASVRQWLAEAGIGLLPAKIGVLALIPGRDHGRVVALRADMDALPIQEDNDVPYRSQVPGRMHACGHDGHTAMLLAAGKILNRHRDLMPMDVLLIFQPAEEGPNLGGARVMLEDLREQGIADKIVKIFGQHLHNDCPTGHVGYRYGSMYASTDEFDITITGRGGHAGQPHHTVDALSVGAKVVTAMESFMSRRIDPFDQAVFSVGIFRAGSAKNVVPETAYIAGTVRCQREDTRALILENTERIVSGVCAAFGASCQVDILHGLPVLVNDDGAVDYAKAVAEGTVGRDRVFMMEHPTMGAEDFTYFARAFPAAFLLLGSGSAEKGFTCQAHQPRFDFDEDAMETGIRMLCNLAVNIAAE